MHSLENMFERRIEKWIDRLDAKLMRGDISQAEYDVEFRNIRNQEDAFYLRLTGRRY
jgi:hypothetical protein